MKRKRRGRKGRKKGDCNKAEEKKKREEGQALEVKEEVIRRGE